jgi:hypothetical protein
MAKSSIETTTMERIRALRDKINKEEDCLDLDDDALVNMALTALEDVRGGW